MTRVGVHNLIGQISVNRGRARVRLACGARAHSPEALLAVVRKIDARSGIHNKESRLPKKTPSPAVQATFISLLTVQANSEL